MCTTWRYANIIYIKATDNIIKTHLVTKDIYPCLDLDPKYGEGIYFAGTVKEAMDVWKEEKDKYLYFVEADVLRGDSTEGQQGLILPPAKGTESQVRYDSVSGGSDISVIFSSYQALPRYIITCEKKQAQGDPKWAYLLLEKKKGLYQL